MNPTLKIVLIVGLGAVALAALSLSQVSFKFASDAMDRSEGEKPNVKKVILRFVVAGILLIVFGGKSVPWITGCRSR